MTLSPLEEIFILLEDEKEVPLFRLNRWGRKARGVLSKLKNAGWSEKVIAADGIYYKITQKGEKEFDEKLRPLRASGSWDGKWRLVLYDIPEKKRAVRDRLRRSLSKLGLGFLQASVWISPHDISHKIAQIAKNLHLEDSLKFFEVSRNPNLDKTIIEKSWNLPELEDEYKKYNFEAERMLKAAQKLPNGRYSAKKLIYIYASILKKDPVLPWEFRDKDELRQRAHQNYSALRKLID